MIEPDAAMAEERAPTEDRPAIAPQVRPHVRSGRARPVVLAAIAIGGALGSLARAALGVAFPTSAGHFPWTTMAINVSGSFVLGVVLVVLLERGGPSRLLRPFVATGFLGGYTTFSTFMVETMKLGRSGHTPTGASYVVASLLLGLTAAWVGVRAGHRLSQIPRTNRTAT